MISPEKHIIKFGGSSLKTSALIDQSAEIVIERMQTARPYVVVSAVGGVTDALIKLADDFAGDIEAASKKIEKLEIRHQQLFDELVSPQHPQRGNLQDLFGEFRNTVKNRSFREENPHGWKDHILSIGERASAIILPPYFQIRNCLLNRTRLTISLKPIHPLDEPRLSRN